MKSVCVGGGVAVMVAAAFQICLSKALEGISPLPRVTPLPSVGLADLISALHRLSR